MHLNNSKTCAAELNMIHFDKSYEMANKNARKEYSKIKKKEYRKNKKDTHIKASADEKKDKRREYIKDKVKEYRKNQRENNEDALKKTMAEEKAKQRRESAARTDELSRRRNFMRATLFGPIFICSCCHRKHFEKAVTKVTENFKDKLAAKKVPYSLAIPPKQEVQVNILLNGSNSLTGIYICHTCKNSLLGGGLPAMAVQNNLHLPKLLEDCKLTELENNLIAKIINFQYIYQLPKSRWGATKKQMISVPVREESLMNTIDKLPRLPKDAGIIPIHLKRKLEYNNSHKKEYVDPARMLRALKHLKDSGHPYYQFCDDFNIDKYKERCKKEDKDGHRLLFSNLEENEMTYNIDDDANISNSEHKIQLENELNKNITAEDKSGNEQSGKNKDEQEHEGSCEDEDEEILIQLDITNDDKIILNIRKDNGDYYRATLSAEEGLEGIQAKIYGEFDEDKIVSEVISIFEEIHLESESNNERSKETILKDWKKMEKILDKVNYFEKNITN